jgi:hypothetical protein
MGETRSPFELNPNVRRPREAGRENPRSSDSMPFPKDMAEMAALIPEVVGGLMRVVEHEGRTRVEDVSVTIDWEYRTIEFAASACECEEKHAQEAETTS